MRNIVSSLLLVLIAPLLHAADPVTFSETIAPILYNNCVTCHRPGEAAPFSLLTYDDAKRRGALIATVTTARYMPPWHAAHDSGEFDGERRLTDKQIAAIEEWVKQGMPEGNRAKLPPAPQFTQGWQLGKPDMVIEMPVGFDLPASGPDVFRNFSIPLNLTEDKWLRAVEFRPSARKAAHHAIFATVQAGSTKRYEGVDGKPGFGGMGTVGVAGLQANVGLGGWAVGGTPVFTPIGIAMPLPKGTDFLLQMHFHPTGKVETEKAMVGLYFAPQPPQRNLFVVTMPALFGAGNGLDIAPGDKSYTIRDSIELPIDVKVFGALVHAHYLGKEIQATATLPDGTQRPLIWIKDWDFNWQEVYNYKDPFVLPKGTRIDAVLRYDNSADNPRNPSNPPKRVLFGEESFDEMGTVALKLTALRKEDEGSLIQTLNARTQADIRKALADGTVKRFLDHQSQQGAPPQSVIGARTGQIAIFDREGKKVQNVGAPGIYAQGVAISPDGTRVAAVRTDPDSGNRDIWVFDVATGRGIAITSDPESNSTPVWSPDGRQLVYVTSAGDSNQIFRKAADGSGQAELLSTQKGTTPFITDWAGDELILWVGKVTYALPVSGDHQLKALSDGKANVRAVRVSPDGRFLAYNSDQSGRFQVYAGPRSAALSTGSPLAEETAVGALFWPAGGKQLYYLTTQGQQTLKVVDLNLTGDTVTASAPRVLFALPSPILAVAQLSSIATPDGQRFVFLVPSSAP